MKSDLSDIDIVRLCAKVLHYQEDVSPKLFDPLHDAAQAFTLVEALRMSVYCDYSYWWAAAEMIDGPHCADLKRAICLCSARVQLARGPGNG